MKLPAFFTATFHQLSIRLNRLPVVNWLKIHTSGISRLGWIWLASGSIVMILLIIAFIHYPRWRSNDIIPLTAASVGFDDAPGYNPDTCTDSIVAHVLEARVYGSSTILTGDDTATSPVETASATDTLAPAGEPIAPDDTPYIDPYDTPET